MKNPLLTLSKTFYGLAFFSLFLPAFIPSCSSRNESSVCSDTVAVKADSSSVTIDTSSTVLTPIPEETKEEVSLEKRSILQPDGQNFSFWGYLLFSVDEGLIWIVVFLLFYTGILKFWNKHHKTSAVLSLLGVCCLTAVDKEKIVWGFWVMYGIYLILAVINVASYYRERRKLFLNKL